MDDWSSVQKSCRRALVPCCLERNRDMPRVVTPRRPARTGRHEGARVARALSPAKTDQKQSARSGDAHVGTDTPVSPRRAKARGPGRGKASAAAPKGRKKTAKSAYN